MQSYYAVNDTQDIIAQKQAGIVQYPYLTYGTFSTNLTPEYRYGIPLSVKMGGVVMDIDKILHTKVEVNNDREKLTAYNLARGPSYSLNENLVPEQLFDNPDTPEKEADGVSAVKALSIAAQQGQTIFTVTKDNIGGGLDGGWTDLPFLSDIILFISTLLLGLSDYDSDIKEFKYDNVKYGKNEYVIRTNFHPDAKLSNLEKLSKLSQRIGWLGLLVANLLVFNNDSLSNTNKMGQISVNTLAFGIIASLTIVSGPLGLLAYMLCIIAISTITFWINTNIFSYKLYRRIKNKVYYYA
ncbi:hypothetical protein [Psychrobacter sp. I-STPA6b]|uniref:hypothetical protein n=1 Tax=Psychrobacter sp. I-STPA6b TaxID=2585718 RepID=UPI001D0CB648|nr:hypothetical protein [Psychrobacter sp. I-STPA6b]